MAALPQAHRPQARVSHFAAGRLRVKIPEKRHDEAFFDRVREQLAAWNSIEAVEVNPLTASVLVRFSDVGALFTENAVKNGLFDLDYDALTADTEPPQPLTDQAAQGFAKADAAIRRWTANAADLRSAVFVFLVGAGLVQVVRGNAAAPAATLFWYAGDMLRLWERVPHPVGRAEGGGDDHGEGQGEG